MIHFDAIVPRFWTAITRWQIAFCLTATIGAVPRVWGQEGVDYGPAIEQLVQTIDDELQQGILTGLSVV